MSGPAPDICNQRPAVQTPDLAREWLDPATPKERAEQMGLFQDEPARPFEWFKVDVAMGNVRNTGLSLIQPLP